MTSPAEIANDLRARARAFDGRHDQGRMLTGDASAMRRAAEMIDHLRLCVRRLEGTDDAEATRRENFRYGGDQ